MTTTFHHNQLRLNAAIRGAAEEIQKRQNSHATGSNDDDDGDPHDQREPGHEVAQQHEELQGVVQRFQHNSLATSHEDETPHQDRQEGRDNVRSNSAQTWFSAAIRIRTLIDRKSVV